MPTTIDGVDQIHFSDPALIQACLAGDQGAWETLVGRYHRLVYAVAHKCGLAETDADDVFQIVFTTLFRRLAGLNDQTRLSAWLITTTYREAWRLGRPTREQAPLDDTIVDLSTPPTELFEQSEREQLVRLALTQIDERCRELLTALFLAPQTPSYEEISSRFAMPIGSIGPTRARCFRKLETRLRAVGLGPED